MKLTPACLLILIFLGSICVNAQIPLRVSAPEDANGLYATSMIKLALAHLDKKYIFETVTSGTITSVRFRQEVKNGNVDVMWTSSGVEIEEELLPVRIPLYKGLLGFRIFLINKKNQYKFDQVKTLDDLRALTMGQGVGWADTAILEANGMNVIRVMKYSGLFYMTDSERFDAFPRGVHEPFEEMSRYPDLDLAVEKNIMLVYKMPFYLFVNKENTRLAKDLTDGLNAAIADGSFDKLFYSTPTVKDVIERANIKSRKVFYLDNPTLPKLTPLDRKELWVDPSQMYE